MEVRRTCCHDLVHVYRHFKALCDLFVRIRVFAHIVLYPIIVMASFGFLQGRTVYISVKVIL